MKTMFHRLARDGLARTPHVRTNTLWQLCTHTHTHTLTNVHTYKHKENRVLYIYLNFFVASVFSCFVLLFVLFNHVCCLLYCRTLLYLVTQSCIFFILFSFWLVFLFLFQHACLENQYVHEPANLFFLVVCFLFLCLFSNLCVV